MKLIIESWRKYLLTESMSEEEVQSIVDRVYPQIVNDRGPAYRPGVPKIELHTDIYARYSDEPGMEGEVSGEAKAEFVDEDNAIYVYHPNMENEEDVIRSLLHEYEHACQDPEEYEAYKAQGYDGQSNPLEVAARDAEEKWRDYLVDSAGEPPQK
tara:strand:- start:1203 stop:1667 length:465 start_codon:yes stop_codon:yes gene_type:complete